MNARPTLPPTRRYQAFLFDMDGTILSSIEATERVWTAWARGHGLAPQPLLATIHGVRAIDTIAALALPGIDPAREAAALTVREIADTAGVCAIAGAAEFLAGLPPERWAIVTSAPRALALARLAAAGLIGAGLIDNGVAADGSGGPAVLITAEDVARGKPAPDGFLAAAARLGVAIADCLVFEDAPAGIRAAEAAGADVLVITATHRARRAGGHPGVPDYRDLAVACDGDGLRLYHR